MIETLHGDRATKDKHRAMWATGDYPAVARRVIPTLGAVLVNACAVGRGYRVLDVAAGAGNAAMPAAEAGADVVASDLTPELLAAGKAYAEQHGARIQWEEADAENLPFDDDYFDVVLSCVGVMFAPHHQASAQEMVRVCRPGGLIGMINWTSDGFLGEMFTTMKPYAPPPPGAQSPLLWGSEAYVRSLFGERVTEFDARREMVTIDCFATPEEFRDFFKTAYGPTVAAYRAVADDPERVAALDLDLAELARRHDQGTDSTTMQWEYLLLTARKRG